MLEDLYERECPQLSAQEIKENAKKVHRQLNTLDVQWRRSNLRFYRNVKLTSDNWQ
jgi:hypothetical protein